MNSNEAEREIKKHGAVKLSKSYSGREILKKAGEKYKIDLLQPGQPGFKEHWGHKAMLAQLAREKQEQLSRDMKGALQERKEWEARERASQGTDWKSKRL